jgi:hypothetical protein
MTGLIYLSGERFTSKSGYSVGMALSAFCTTCQRTVYVDSDDTPMCPVCSTPLLETVPAADGNANGAAAQTEDAAGAK